MQVPRKRLEPPEGTPAPISASLLRPGLVRKRHPLVCAKTKRVSVKRIEVRARVVAKK